jgi:hypothetical protein
MIFGLMNNEHIVAPLEKDLKTQLSNLGTSLESCRSCVHLAEFVSVVDPHLPEQLLEAGHDVRLVR